MATSAQKAALAASKNNVNTTKKNTAASKKAYNTATTNYKNAVNKGYQPSKQVKTYQSASDKALAAASAMGNFGYDSKYTDKITGLLDKAENMDFNMNYSLTDDPAYQQYRDEQVHNGQLAAQEAAGNAIAQTGGYGSTAASTAASQAYNESLSSLNDIVPELYGQAYNREWNKFTNERDTLQQLAAAYQAQDQMEYDQALSTWNNNFNQYITIAQEYQKKYEYLDSADRAAYEQKLDGLYNLLTSAQSQYNTDQNIEQTALNTYSGTATDIANYDETVRSNKANEAHNAAVLAEQIRANKASEALQRQSLSSKGSSGGGSSRSSSGGGTNKKQTKQFTGSAVTDGWISNVPSNQIGKSKNNYDNLTASYNKGGLSEKEYAYLLAYYGFA